MRAKIIGISIGLLMVTGLLPLSLAETTDSGVELEIMISTGPVMLTPHFRVTNIGDQTAHNVKVTDTLVEGDVLYNNRVMKIADSLAPEETERAYLKTGIIGYGVITIMINVTCDEGVFSSGPTNGFIIGPFILIP